MSNNPKRKPNRIPKYDYSQIGAYFITICTKDMKHLFGHIVGAASCRPHTLLSNTGKIIENEINTLSTTYETLTVDCYIIMPNHIHLLVSIHGSIGRQDAAPTLSRAIGMFKRAVSIKSKTSPWQKGFHDHVIRNDRAYQKIWQYIENNPYTWVEDRYYTQEGS
ncbi:MAG: transposase [Defluviitaleaceae bacterium]|nr:transposase [Defluviitaleaceae bacterium]